jgi:hypothetical protein
LAGSGGIAGHLGVDALAKGTTANTIANVMIGDALS